MNSRFIPLFAAVLLASPVVLSARQPDPQPTDVPKPADPVDSSPGEQPAPAPEDVKPAESPAEIPVEKKPLPAPAPKSDAPDSPAKAILRRSADAIKSARSLSFKVKLFGEGGMLAGAPSLEAEVKMLKSPSDPNAWLIRAIGNGSNANAAKDGAPKAADPSGFDVVWTASTTSWIDHVEKIVYTRPLNAARGKASQAASSAKLRYFQMPSPFQKELLPADFTQEDSASVNGEMCDITSTRAERGNHDRYSISQRDSFPRRIEKIFDSERVKGRYVTEFTDVKINEDIAEAYFKLPVPEGYKENIQEAPKPVTPPEAPKIDPSRSAVEGESAAAIQGDSSAVVTDPAAPVLPVPPVIESAPDVDLPLNSGTIKMSSLKGNVVVLDFFGTWALTSKGTHEELKKCFDKFKDRSVRFISCAVRERNPDAAAEYLSHNQFSWDLAKRGESVASAFKVKTYPFWIVVDKDGNIKLHLLGNRTDAPGKLDDAISEALGIEKTPRVETPSEPAKAVPAASVDIPAGGEPAPADIKK